jgi:NOL1/NOP2/fmu family ribosome biogenesis protein
MAKWATINSMVTNNYPKDFSRLPDFFDVMVVDAPCSGSGLFRKQEDAIEHWSEENVHHCSLRQQRILTDLVPSLKENGILIYSTCSYSEEENETICDCLCDNFSLEPIKLKTLDEWGVLETQSEKHKAYGYRFLPYLLQGEGFFLACFRKKENKENREIRSVRNFFTKISANEIAAVKNHISSENIDYSIFQEEIIGFHKSNFQAIQKITSALKVKKMPIHIGQLKGTDFIPHPYLAYQNILQDFPQINIDTSVALQYLRKQPFVLDSDIKGFALLAFQSQNLGWFKNLGNRINNYYPADWRILKDSF